MGCAVNGKNKPNLVCMWLEIAGSEQLKQLAKLFKYLLAIAYIP